MGARSRASGVSCSVSALTLALAPQMMKEENYILGSMISEVAGLVSVVSVEINRN